MEDEGIDVSGRTCLCKHGLLPLTKGGFFFSEKEGEKNKREEKGEREREGEGGGKTLDSRDISPLLFLLFIVCLLYN